MSKETFYGVKEIVENQKIGSQPIVFIIKNIKAFNHVVLNELIHLLKKYRHSDGLNLCLMLGVQNNNRDEVHLRINIQNCTKLALKTFYFPSMKNIIFEVINLMLLTKKAPATTLMPLTFSQKLIENLVETINLYGMSVNKFKRTLRLILVENLFANPLYFVHEICLDLKVGFESSQFKRKVLIKQKEILIKKFELKLRMMNS